MIVKASGNRMLEHVWQTMRLSITTCLTVSITHRSLREIAERHVAVLEALRSGDPDRAESAIKGATSKSPASGARSAHQQEQAARPAEPDEKEASM